MEYDHEEEYDLCVDVVEVPATHEEGSCDQSLNQREDEGEEDEDGEEVDGEDTEVEEDVKIAGVLDAVMEALEDMAFVTIDRYGVELFTKE